MDVRPATRQAFLAIPAGSLERGNAVQWAAYTLQGGTLQGLSRGDLEGFHALALLTLQFAGNSRLFLVEYIVAAHSDHNVCSEKMENFCYEIRYLSSIGVDAAEGGCAP
jgi:hypothetical protein